MFIALSFKFICVYPVPLLLCSRTERLHLWCKSLVLDCSSIWRRIFHTYGITSLDNPEEQSWFSPSCKISYIRRYFEGHSKPCDTQTTLVMSPPPKVVVGRKCYTPDIQQWHWKMRRMPTILVEKQVTVSAEPLAQLPLSDSVRVDSFAHLVLSMAASSSGHTCLAFRVAWRCVHTRPKTHVVIIGLDLHLG